MGEAARVTAEPHLWDALGSRLDRLAAERDGPVGFWLRDDDAEDVSPALDRLLDIAAEQGVPLALAVIPAGATDALAGRLAPLEGVRVLQHGWRHANHAPADAKRAELGDHRPAAATLAEIAAGRDRLAGFPRVAPIMVPPWNRIGPAVEAALPALGFRAVSGFGARRPGPPAGPARRNVHLDPMLWRPVRRFAGRAATLRLLLARLDALLSGAADPAEPTGIMTHHLVHDDAAFTFLSDLVGYLARRKDCRFLSADDLLANF